MSGVHPKGAETPESGSESGLRQRRVCLKHREQCMQRPEDTEAFVRRAAIPPVRTGEMARVAASQEGCQVCFLGTRELLKVLTYI